MTTIIEEADYLAHYGTPRRSGRYPWGTSGWGAGDDVVPGQRNMTFSQFVGEMRKKGLSDTEIARGLGISRTELQAKKTIERNEQRAADVAFARRLKDKGTSNTAIAERLYGDPKKESTVRNLLKEDSLADANILSNVVDMLKRMVGMKTYIDVGAGVETQIPIDGINNRTGISEDRLKVALAMMKEEGYEVHPVKIRQLGTGKDTQLKVLTPPGTSQYDVFMNRDKIQQITEFSDDNGRSFSTFQTPISIDPKRVQIRYAEDGGAKEDGVIYVRPGVDDISLGKSNYAQVRVQIGDGHYLKGMAIYRDDLPPGVDLVFNSNKERAKIGDKSELDYAAKPLKDDKDLPFGSVVRQIKDTDGNVSSSMNLVYEQGDWRGWSDTISAQVLSKQSPQLAKRQLDLAYENRKAEYDELMSLTNPTVKRKLLENFADSTDSASVHLKAAALPRQNWHVIIPTPSLKATEIYAPNYKDGERVALIRYPHGGTFEIPELTVNNRNREARKTIGTDSSDAVGINHKVAERLSGADFDGDTVLVIPNGHRRIQSTPALQGLKDFDPVRAYPAYEGMPKLTDKRKQQLMGDVSNLITDMTILGASPEEIAPAVRHSMVVIDAEKKNLNWRQSEKDNGIRALKQKYQGKTNAGASTIVSRKKSYDYAPETRLRRQSEGGPIDPKTGRKVYVPTGRMTTSKSGEVVPRRERINKLSRIDDAHDLVSKYRTPVERHYANYSNEMKTLAGKARLSAAKTPRLKRTPGANKTYAPQVKEIDAALALANRNRPLERQAQVLANAEVKAKRQADPNMIKEVRQKVEYQALANARNRTGAAKTKLVLTDKQWEAIQAGAISDTKLQKVLMIADEARVRELATPRTRLKMTKNKQGRARAMLANGFTRAEVAAQLGVSLTTLDDALAGRGGE